MSATFCNIHWAPPIHMKTYLLHRIDKADLLDIVASEWNMTIEKISGGVNRLKKLLRNFLHTALSKLI